MNHLPLNRKAMTLVAAAIAVVISSSAGAQTPTVYFDPSDSGTTTAGGAGDFATSDFFDPNSDTDSPFVSGTNGVGVFSPGEGAIFNGPASTVTVSAPVSPVTLEVGVTSGTETFGTTGANASEITFPEGNANSPGDGANTATIPVTQYYLTPIKIDAGSENVVFNSGLNFAGFNRYYNVSNTVNSSSSGNVTFNGGITFTNNVSAATSDDPVGQGAGEPNVGLTGVAGTTFTINSAVSQVHSPGAATAGNAPYVALETNNTLTLTKNASFNGVIVAAYAGTILDQGASYTTAPNFNTQGIVVGNTGQFLTDTAGMNITSGVQFTNGGGTVGSALAAETTYSGTVIGYSGADMDLTSGAGGRVDFTGDVVNGNGEKVVKVGAGTINLNNANPYTENQGGGWEVKNGTMLLNGTVANNTAITGSGLEIDNVANASLVPNVQTYATLGGNGSTAVAVTADGANSSITPGDPTVNGGIGTLTLGTVTQTGMVKGVPTYSRSGGLTANDGLTMNFVIDAAGDGSLLVVPTLTLNGPVQVNFTTLDSVTTGINYLLVEGGNSGVDWTLGNNLSFNFTGPAGYAVSSYTLDTQGDTLSVQFESVPEPSAYGMMGLGLLALIGIRRFRQLS